NRRGLPFLETFWSEKFWNPKNNRKKYSGLSKAIWSKAPRIQTIFRNMHKKHGCDAESALASGQ
ncbi:MAG: hypothetical protein VW169_16835, partial [Rhodospirillaceae bacterium]